MGSCNRLPGRGKESRSRETNGRRYGTVMHITYKIKPDRVADFKRAFDRCAVETLKEPGCLKYEIYQSYNDTTLFFLLEKWQHKQAHQKHSQTEHLKAYFKAIEGAFDQGGSFELLRIPPAIEAE